MSRFNQLVGRGTHLQGIRERLVTIYLYWQTIVLNLGMSGG